MDTTASSFTLRKNAKRAAEAMIRKGTAPAVDYGIEPSDNGRFEIDWKTAKTAPATGEIETEIAEALADDLPLRRRLKPRHRRRPPSTRQLTSRRSPCQRLRPRHSPRQRPPSPPWH
jgi:hypothetical protein